MSTIFKKLQLAIKSRKEYQKKLTPLQKRRLNICRECPLNSDNKEQLTLLDTFKMRLNKILNFIMNVSVDDDSICTSCGCNLIFKSSQEDPENMCPLKKWDNLKKKKMKIESKFNLVQNVENESYDINFGTIKKGADTKVVIKFSDVNHLSVTKSCGCTMPTIALLPEGGFNLIIEYDNQKIGVISQVVLERVVDNKNEQKVVTFHLKGTIVE